MQAWLCGYPQKASLEFRYTGVHRTFQTVSRPRCGYRKSATSRIDPVFFKRDGTSHSSRSSADRDTHATESTIDLSFTSWESKRTRRSYNENESEKLVVSPCSSSTWNTAELGTLLGISSLLAKRHARSIDRDRCLRFLHAKSIFFLLSEKKIVKFRGANKKEGLRKSRFLIAWERWRMFDDVWCCVVKRVRIAVIVNFERIVVSENKLLFEDVWERCEADSGGLRKFLFWGIVRWYLGTFNFAWQKGWEFGDCEFRKDCCLENKLLFEDVQVRCINCLINFWEDISFNKVSLKKARKKFFKLCFKESSFSYFVL